jgi:hypothetical protein
VVAMLLRRAGRARATGRPKWRPVKPDQVGGDLVDRQCSRSRPNQCGSPTSPSTPPGRARPTGAIIHSD